MFDNQLKDRRQKIEPQDTENTEVKRLKVEGGKSKEKIKIEKEPLRTLPSGRAAGDAGEGIEKGPRMTLITTNYKKVLSQRSLLRRASASAKDTKGTAVSGFWKKDWGERNRKNGTTESTEKRQINSK